MYLEKMKKIILASQSPRRKMLLEWAEVEFEIKVKETDETFPAGTNIEEVPVIIARNKALAIERSENDIVLAADTIVVLENEIIGKPANMDRSEEHTSELQSLAYLVCRLLLEKKKKNKL